MAVISKQFVEDLSYGNPEKSTWTIKLECPDQTVSDDFVFAVPICKIKYVYPNKNMAIFNLSVENNPTSLIYDSTSYTFPKQGDPYAPNYPEYGLLSSGTERTIKQDNDEYIFEQKLSDFFNETNRTSNYINRNLVVTFCGVVSGSTDGTRLNGFTKRRSDGIVYNNISRIYLNVPPTATIDPLSKNTNDYYAKNGDVPITTVSVSIRDLTAYYGGDFTTTTEHPAGVKFEIGNQSDEAHPEKTDTIDTHHARFADTSLSIDLDTAGTFTPKVTVTDSRGQTYVKTFDPITVQEYNPTTNITTLLRVNATGEPEDDPQPGHFSDEGTNAVVACVFDYPTIESNYMKPPLVKIDGQSPTNIVDWYTSWTESGGFSGQISFSSYNPTRPVTLYGKIIDTLAKNTSYEISVACDTTLVPENYNYDFKLLPQAFYLLSAPEGGHGLGIGRKVPVDAEGRGLHVGMNAIFYEDVIFKRMAGIIQMTACPAGGPGSSILIPADGITVYEPIAGWLICNGAEVSRTVYSELFDVIGTSYGDGDGSDTFNLPDLRGRFPLGSGDGTATGHTSHSIGENAMGGNEDLIVPYHRHNVAQKTNGAISKTLSGSFNVRRWGSSGGGTVTDPSGNVSISGKVGSAHGIQNLNNSQGSNTVTINMSHAHDIAQHYTDYEPANDNKVGANMPPFIGVNFIIATGKML